MIDFPRTAAIFDLDGTLLDTLEDLYLATNQALTRHSLPARTRDEVRMFVGNGVEMLIRRAVPAETAENTVAAVLADFKAIYATICEDHTAPYPGIPELLARLGEEGVPLAVVSNKGDAAVRELMDATFPGAFRAVVGEREGVRRKPAPDTVDEVMRQLQLSPTDVVLVGDSEVDVATAANAGCACIAVTWCFETAGFPRGQKNSCRAPIRATVGGQMARIGARRTCVGNDGDLAGS